jgi:hypothetical protein
MKTKIQGKFHIEKVKESLIKNGFSEDQLKSTEFKTIYSKTTDRDQPILVSINPKRKDNEHLIIIELMLTSRQQLYVFLSRIIVVLFALGYMFVYDLFLKPRLGNGLLKLLLFYFPWLGGIKYFWYKTKDSFYNQSEAKMCEKEILQLEVE